MTQDGPQFLKTAYPPFEEIVTPLSARALFWRPRHLAPSPALEHLPFLFWLIDLMRPTRFVQLGLGDGVGYFAACQAMDKLGQEVSCHGFGAAGGWPDRAAIPAEAETYNETQYGDFSHLLTGDPAAMSRQFADGSIDLLAFDGVPDAALLDSLEQGWMRKLSPQAVLLFHGLGVPGAPGGEGLAGPGAEAARTMLERLCLRHPAIGFATGTGLVTVLHGPQRNERLVKLAGLDFGTPGHAEVHHVFRRLGAANRHEATARAERDRAESALEQAHAAEQGRAELHARQARLDDALRHLGDAYERSGQQVGALDAELAALRRAQEGHEARIAELTARLETAARDTAAALEARDRALLQGEERLSSARKALSEAERAQAALQAELGALGRERDTGLTELQAERDRAERDRTRAEALQAERDSLARDLADTRDRAGRAAAALARAEAAGQDAGAERAALRAALETARAAAGDAAQDNERLAQEQVQRDRDHAEDLRVLTGRIEALREEDYRRAEAERDMQARLRQLEAERDEARQLVDELLASTSWKLTAPARRVVLAMRRRGPGSDPQT